MKTLLRSLACAALCCVGVTSCVYDDYGYGYAGAPVGYGGYYGRGYPSYYSPGFSSLSVGYYGGGGYPYYGGYGYPYGYRSYPYRYSSYRSGYPYGGGYNRYSSQVPLAYSARYARPSSFRGSTMTTTPTIPSFSPRTITRPSGSSLRAPTGRFSSPAPSGRASRPLTTVSRSVPSVSTRAAVTTRPASVSTSAAANSRYHRTR
ncbi:MAG TPA: hypothetical protein VD994_15820 [Prosthecobacter sp.]|nr:hypothetical protein [Prosthecobacter sp.]